jgi:hypothetical protein
MEIEVNGVMVRVPPAVESEGAAAIEAFIAGLSKPEAIEATAAPASTPAKRSTKK